MNRYLSIVITLVIIFSSPVGFSESMILEVIPLKYRLVDDVVPILQPLVVPGGTITGMNNQLIVKTTPGNLIELKNILENLDRSPRRLMITVKQDIGGNFTGQESAISGRYSSGDVSVRNRSTVRGRDGLVISAEDDDGNIIRYRNRSTQSNIDDRNTFTVQATEGYPAFVQTGQSVPVPSSTALVTPGGVIVSDSVEYHDVTSGFYVLPRLNGDHVTLLVVPKLSRTGQGKQPVFDIQNVQTTASGRLGEWIHLGGVDQNISDNQKEILSSSSTRQYETRSVLVKVDEIK